MGFFDKLWEGVKGVAQVAAFIPGPIGTAGKIISTIGAATSKTKNPADAANAQIQAGADAQMAYQQQAMKQYQDLMNRQLAVGTADKQMAYDVNRGVYQSNQANMLPYQTASLSALQALPQLQQLLGMQAYNVGNTISSYTPPAVNYADLYKNSQTEMFPEDGVNAPGSETNPGLRVNQVVGGTAAEQQAANTGSSQSTALTPYTGPAYDLTNSPLFQYQKQIADEGLTNQLASQGLSGGTYAQRELSRQNMALTANERERVVNNLQSMVTLGNQGAQLGQTRFTTPQSTDVSNALGQGAQDIASFYGNMGAIQGQLGSQLANSSIASANYNANQPSGMQTAMEMASQYGWLNPTSKTSTASSSNPGYNPSYFPDYQLKTGSAQPTSTKYWFS